MAAIQGTLSKDMLKIIVKNMRYGCDKALATMIFGRANEGILTEKKEFDCVVDVTDLLLLTSYIISI